MIPYDDGHGNTVLRIYPLHLLSLYFLFEGALQQVGALKMGLYLFFYVLAVINIEVEAEDKT